MELTEYWYRAMCFGRAIGPWRKDKAKARADLLNAKLGSFDELGDFYCTVPGNLQIRIDRVSPGRLPQGSRRTLSHAPAA